MSPKKQSTPFHEHLRSLLLEQDPPMTQAMLATLSSLDPSLVSRLMSGKRDPTTDALLSIASALKIDVATLVKGTNAETQPNEIVDRIPIAAYHELVAKLVEFEAKAREADSRVERLRLTAHEETRRKDEALREAAEARSKADDERLARLTAEQRVASLEKQLAAANQSVKRLAAAYEELRNRVSQLKQELSRTEKSANFGALLASVGAAASVATLGLLFTDDESETTTKRTPPKKAKRTQ